jgi:DnaK suppressor protein
MARGATPRPAGVLRRLSWGSEVDTNAVRDRLLKRRDELRQRASDASADLRHEADPLSADFAEQVTQRENDDVLGAISHSAQEELQQVESALRRLASGRYATCSVCGEDIEPERLVAVPYTDRCRSCAEAGRAAGRRGARG